MCFITFQAKMVQWKQVTWQKMLAWKWWIQSCLRWESSVGSPCHLVSLCFVAHHFIKLTLISNIESLGISASADFWLIVLTDKVMLWCNTYYRVYIYTFIHVPWILHALRSVWTIFGGRSLSIKVKRMAMSCSFVFVLSLSLQALYSPLNIRF